MSVFISFMPSVGLSDSPPLSNVMPLPTSTTCCVPLFRLVIAEFDQARRADRPRPDRDQAAEPVRGQLVFLPHPGREPTASGHRHRLIRQPGRGLAPGWHVGEVTGECHRACHGPGRREHVRMPVRPVRPGHQQAHLAGAVSAAAALLRACENRYEPRSRPTMNACIASAGFPNTAEVTRARPGATRRPTAAPALRHAAGDSSPSPRKRNGPGPPCGPITTRRDHPPCRSPRNAAITSAAGAPR